MEAVVMFKADQGNAWVVVRVNQPGPGNDEMHGNYAGFNPKTLYLGKMRNHWQALATLSVCQNWSAVSSPACGTCSAWRSRVNESAFGSTAGTPQPIKAPASGSTSPTSWNPCYPATWGCGPQASKPASIAWWSSRQALEIGLQTAVSTHPHRASCERFPEFTT
ncbi:MAG: hypothetical protein NTW21_16900 [Verrucomicrobia bacterium]|nr:hypothetical protein [Verrucomicrobiota bacterium]